MDIASLGNAKTCSGPVLQVQSDVCSHKNGPLRPLEEHHEPACSLMWPLSEHEATDGVEQYHVQYDLDVVALQCTYGSNQHYHLYMRSEED